MKKVILTESQTKTLMDNIIKEQTINDRTNLVYATGDFGYIGTTFKGGEIADISKINFELSYIVDIEWRKYGIKGIYVTNIKGPSHIELEISYYPANDPDGDFIEENITIPIDWNSQVITNETDDLGYFGVDSDIEINLTNDNNGNIIVKNIEINVQNF
ncbi:MAG: hypothetical protein BWX59_01986 [Bacteroidetes bacterium ADurb.Bin028]|jgi:hypothetical protein|nr:MAG: hypothetical protein BWX59_01986 [Bacteroidetes bacterium ADurb.Bin028]